RRFFQAISQVTLWDSAALPRLISGPPVCTRNVVSRSSQARKVSALFAICATFAAAPANAETLTLAQAIEMGLQKAPEVREAKFRTESADYGITAARGRYYPTLSVSGQTGYGNNLSRTPLKGEEFVRNPANPNQ